MPSIDDTHHSLRDRAELLGALMRDVRIQPDRAASCAVVPAHLIPQARSGDVLRLEPARAGAIDLETCLRSRSAERAYSPEPITRAELASLLAAAADVDADLWDDERDAGVELELVCAVSRVVGLRPGIYAAERNGEGLRRLASLPEGDAAEELVLQREFASAPVILSVIGPLGAALARHGNHGHRLLLTRAGASAHAAWLSALANGLVGTVFAGLLPHVLRERAGVDGYVRAPLFAVSVGRPRAGSSVLAQMEGGENNE